MNSPSFLVVFTTMAKTSMHIRKLRKPCHRPPTNEQCTKLQQQTEETNGITQRPHAEEADGNNIFYKFNVFCKLL